MTESVSEAPSPESAMDLAIAHHKAGRYPQAEHAYTAILAKQPGRADAHHLLGVLRLQAGMEREARAAIRKAIALEPAAAPYYSNLGNTERSLGDLDHAGRLLRHALALQPDYADARHNLGLVLLHAGNEAEGLAHLNTAIRLQPRPIYYYSLANASNLSSELSHIADLERQLRDVDTLSVEDRIYLRFALAKLCKESGRPDDALVHLLEGNTLRRSITPYDERAVADLFAHIGTVFSGAFMADRSREAPPDGSIFIVGMPRSGTSLVEQILASHPRVFGAGELDLMDRLASNR